MEKLTSFIPRIRQIKVIPQHNTTITRPEIAIIPDPILRSKETHNKHFSQEQ